MKSSLVNSRWMCPFHRVAPFWLTSSFKCFLYDGSAQRTFGTWAISQCIQRKAGESFQVSQLQGVQDVYAACARVAHGCAVRGNGAGVQEDAKSGDEIGRTERRQLPSSYCAIRLVNSQYALLYESGFHAPRHVAGYLHCCRAHRCHHQS
ncbi:hypothetical protein LY78DRAFT_222486 [Colletotrichum sublineola]|nr:hypothetical protein LY78DRAFT_222486 [Colletotrichum sublineola]